ncbi:UDP-N-acetylmuramoyl-tripeptide--D-alanyl-D-alanine ligase [Brevibacillus daliensis]|uniref:UDP-N-acetylmuramoyl-tripeptide--D-alanyl-D- alanine ligase n=1 Tax=Brevibacillus daliensis TaxID=2892995 RepID=UPI001E2DFE53|nr:UDP-N-acetylmuramoyl-tripeptide--D-alanyl-D-alanine ligase [Brevibacillus daliensis]
MKPTSLKQLSKLAQGILLQGDPEAMITGAHFDSRQLTANSLFVPLVQERDGHDYMMTAVEQGATAVLVSNPEKIPADLPKQIGLILVNDTLTAFQKLGQAYRNQFSIPFIAVTGSNGKTTTKDMIAHILSHSFSVCKTYKNFNNHIGLPFSLLQLDDSHQVAVMEVGMSHPGEIDLLAGIVQPMYSVITNIGDAHIGYFGTQDKIALAKAELLPHTKAEGQVYLNADDPYLAKVSHLTDAHLRYYSISKPADIWADDLVSDETGSHFTVYVASGESQRMSMPLLGHYNVANVLPAIGIARDLGMSLAEIKEALLGLQVSSMRFEIIPCHSNLILVNDSYNASPYSMKTALDTFANLYPERPKVAILGDIYELGDDSLALHASVGEFLSSIQDKWDLIVTVGDHSHEISNAFTGAHQHFNTKEDAVAYLSDVLSPEHAVIIKGSRGMKMETMLDDLQKL